MLYSFDMTKADGIALVEIMLEITLPGDSNFMLPCSHLEHFNIPRVVLMLN
jgi:hypothetical protein